MLTDHHHHIITLAAKPINGFSGLLALLFTAVFLTELAAAQDLSKSFEKGFTSLSNKPAGECIANPASQKEMLATGGLKVNFDGGCFVKLHEIDIKDYLLVDVRSQTDYQNGHIDGSINIPLNQISQQSFLKNRKLLIINSGFPQYGLGQYCNILKEHGFAGIHILDGGIHNWLGSGRELKGRRYREESFEIVNVEDFFMDYEHGLVEAIHLEPEKSDVHGVLPDVIPWNDIKLNDELAERLSKLFQSSVANHKKFVLITSEDQYLAAKSAGKIAVLKDVYYLLGNRDTLAKYKAERIAMNKVRISGPKKSHCGD